MSDDFDNPDPSDTDGALDGRADGDGHDSADLGWIDELVDAWSEDESFDVIDPAPEDRIEGEIGGEGEETVAGFDPEHDRHAVDDSDQAIDLDVTLDDHPIPDAETPTIVGDGDLHPDHLRDALAAVGADDAAAVVATLEADQVEPRQAVFALDAAGIESRVEYADIGTLVEAVDDGVDVLLIGTSGSYAVAAIDVSSDIIELQTADGAGLSMSLRDLAEAWEVVDHEVLVLPEPAGPVRLVGATMVIAVDPVGLGADATAEH